MSQPLEQRRKQYASDLLDTLFTHSKERHPGKARMAYEERILEEMGSNLDTFFDYLVENTGLSQPDLREAIFSFCENPFFNY